MVFIHLIILKFFLILLEQLLFANHDFSVALKNNVLRSDAFVDVLFSVHVRESRKDLGN